LPDREVRESGARACNIRPPVAERTEFSRGAATRGLAPFASE
jgi:hypothetical protein